MILLPAAALSLYCGSASAAGPAWQERLAQAERLSEANKDEESAKAAWDSLADAEKTLGPDAPEIGRILARLSRIEEKAGDAARLPEIERRLAAIKSKDFDVWSALGELRRGEGRSLEAESALKNALALKPEDLETKDELAAVYDDLGRYEEEARLLSECIKNEPENYDLLIQLANADTRLGRSAEAKEVFAQAAKIKGRTADAYIEEGYFYLDSDQRVHAREDFENAIAVDTGSPWGYHHMGSYLAQTRQYPEAEKYFSRALKKLESDSNAKPRDLLDTVNWLGDVIEAQGRHAEAEAVYLKGLKSARPGDNRQLRLLRSLAKLYVSAGKNEQAEAAYKRAVDACGVRFKCQSVSAARTLLDLGQFYLSQGRRPEAEGMAERAEKAGANIPIGQGFGLLRDLAAFYANLGDVPKREALYGRLMSMRRAMPFNPDLIWVETEFAGMKPAEGAAGTPWRERLAQAERLSMENKTGESVKAAGDVLADAEKSLGPDAPELGRVLSRMSRIYDKAEDVRLPEIEERLSAVKSKDFEVWSALGDLWRGERRFLEAEDALKKALALKPDDPGAEDGLVALYDEMGRYEDEARFMKKCIGNRPQDYEFAVQLAHLYARLGRSSDAKGAFAQAAKIKGRTADAYIAEGYFSMGPDYTGCDYLPGWWLLPHSTAAADDAESYFEKAIAVDTASPFGYHHMGSYLAHRRRYAESEKYFRRALDLLEADPGASVEDILHTMSWLRDVLEAQGRRSEAEAEAEAVYRKAQKTAQGNGAEVLLLLPLGDLYAAQGKSAQAEESYKRASAVCRAHEQCQINSAGDALIALGRFYLNQGRRPDAEAAAERAEKDLADVPIVNMERIKRARLRTLKSLAALYADLGNVPKRDALYGRLTSLRAR